MPFDWKQHDVCLTDELGGFVAVSPKRDLEDKAVVWFSLAGRSRKFPVHRVLADAADYFAFEDDRGRHHALRPITLEGYEAVREQLAPGNPKFTDLEKLREAAHAAASLQS